MKTILTPFIFLLASLIPFSGKAKTDKITGVIHSAADNRTLANCRVKLLLDDEVFDEKITEADGKFSFYRLDSGAYTVQVELNNYKTYEHELSIGVPANITHSIQIYLQPSNVTIAKADVRDYPEKSEFEYFLLHHQFASYDTDSTMVVAASGPCAWNEQHELLYVSALKLKVNAQGEVTILPGGELLGAYEVVPDVKAPAPVTAEENGKKKWVSILDRLSKTAEKVITENPDMIKMGK